MHADTMKEALKALDKRLEKPLSLVIAGGAAMVLGYGFPLATHDIDAVPFQSELSIADVDALAKEVALSFKTKIPADWINPYYESFSYVLPKDYGSRLKLIYKGKSLSAYALGVEDLLILKVFARRDKDIPHIRFLLKQHPNLDVVESHIHALCDKHIPKAQAALDFLDEILADVAPNT